MLRKGSADSGASVGLATVGVNQDGQRVRWRSSDLGAPDRSRVGIDGAHEANQRPPEVALDAAAEQAGSHAVHGPEDRPTEVPDESGQRGKDEEVGVEERHVARG